MTRHACTSVALTRRLTCPIAAVLLFLTTAAPAAPVVPPPAFASGALKLIDEVNCGNAADPHAFQQVPANASSIQTLLGRPARVLSNTVAGPKYFAYKLGVGKNLVAGKAYVLAVEYPDDVPRTILVANNGAEYVRGFTTGNTVGDALHPPYVDPNPESLQLPQSGAYQTWQTLFHLHDRYPTIKRPRAQEFPRDMTPASGFWVIIAQFRPEDAPFSQGAAVSKIKLYEAPAAASYYAPVTLPPAGLPQRHLFFREEMADQVIAQTNAAYLGVTTRVNWFAYKARLMKFLGMNTFSKDLLEFGANQGWDSAPFGGNNWVYQSSTPTLWADTIAMLQGYDLNVMPYYEYSGSKGGSMSLGFQKRALPLTRNDAYTHISWTETARADLTDPDTLTDFKKMLDCTVVPFVTRKKFAGVWLRPRSSQMPIGFADATLARFASEANNGVSVTRAQIQADSVLRQRYYNWWLLKRRAFIDAVTDYLRSKGAPADLVTLYTTDASEPGRPDPAGNSSYVVAESTAAWAGRSETVASLASVLSANRQFNTLTLPRSTWGGWEWQHADVWNDPQNYTTDTKGALTYTFNHAYTVGRADALNAFRSGAGLAMIRHYALNEDTMTSGSDPLLGYFVTDVERAGPYCMLTEARAVANGDPRFIGYLASSSFNRGFPEYVRAFNQAFLALPALPSAVVANAASNANVVVRSINAGANGTYLAVVNTSVTQADNVAVTLPVAGTVKDLVSGTAVPVASGKITLAMYPCQLRSFLITPAAAGPTIVRVEAESGTLKAPMQIKSDTKASGGKYITVKSGTATPFTPVSTMKLTVNIPRTGKYRIWGRVLTPTDSDDSFYLRLDNTTWVTWNHIGPYAGWSWALVRRGGASAAIAEYQLTAGTHTIDIGHRENGARFDRLILTDSATYKPTGLGN